MAGRYETLIKVEHYRIDLDTKAKKTKPLYVAWYDAMNRQACRRSLETEDLEKAVTTVRGLVDRGFVGDPSEGLKTKKIQTVGELLDVHAPAIEKLASAEAGGIQAKRIRRLLGEQRRLASLVKKDFEIFRDACLAEGLALSTIDRTLSTLVAAIRDAKANKLVKADEMPVIPKFCTKNDQRNAPPKGRIMTMGELARLIDAIDQLHLLLFLILLINTASRPGALLDMQMKQIDLEAERVDLNPIGRVQTSKWRPVLPLTDTLRPWVSGLNTDYLVTWRRRPVAEIDTAFVNACCKAGLPGGEAGYSLRHMIGRWMLKRRVPREEIAVWLGHIQPPQNPKTTLVYSPYEPAYLMNAKAAVEAFVRELNKLTKRDLLLPPWKQ